MAFRRTRFRRTRLVLLAAVLAAPALGVVLPAAPASADLASQCRDSAQDQLPVAGVQTCRSIQAGEWDMSAACRKAQPDATAQCATFDDRPVSEQFITDFQGSWLHRALRLQRALDANAPLNEELIPHTHNTFNSSAYDPTLTNQDPNQVYSITDQLQMDIRAIEIDLHWVPSPFGSAESGGYEVTACHGTSEGLPADQHVHVGCTADRPAAAALDEVRAWLDAHPGEFLIIYLENQLDGSVAGHTRAGQLLDEKLGSLVYKPPADQPCAAMPATTSAATILATGAQVLLVGICDASNGMATTWGNYVHDRGAAWLEASGPSQYGDAECATDLAGNAAGRFRRYYEEVTWLAAMGDTAPPVTSPVGSRAPIPTDQVARMVRCGVNIIGLDQLTPTDPRLGALVWSWAQDEPAPAGGCAYQGGDTRFRAASCDDTTRHFACHDANGWHETVATGSWDQGYSACATEFAGSAYSVPVNGWGNGSLASAKAAAADEVWLNYKTLGTTWTGDVPPPPSLPQSGSTTSDPTPGVASTPAPAVAAAPARLPARLASSSRHRAPRLPLALVALAALPILFWARKRQHDAVSAPRS